ncbi:MAG: T9SS type A sorting domain-containing protein [Chitinophaga sp.]|uniref:fibronectin type III domain-containing protein n=1 Tax=Chitinophaga sp. TaxID=1869181 RepID=UPI0025BDD73F|nr:LamG-like jellyroll fold domain-containing protein [Chitinophaga sp.]MBV8253772.1 T9SS type A sorting domain-containing protein [Chitinophaga sp.]
MQKFLQILFCVLLLCFKQASSQSVIDPNDPIVRYTGGTLPAQPADGVIGKWISTDRSGNMPYGWKSTALKAYIYKGMAFRVQFPKSYNPTANDGKKYPIFVFFHGRGEAGPIQDNEWQLYHGGYIFSNAVLNGQFDGYLLYPQSTGGFWTDFELSRTKEILDYMAANNKVDLLRVIDNGLSSGGAGTWTFKLTYPSYVATCLPMSSSGVSLKDPANIDKYKFTPVWLFQGALDGSPAPYTSTDVVNTAKAAGANIRYTIYDGVAHDTWYHAWAESDFLPTMNRAHILTPYPLFGRAEFCVGDPIGLTVGISPGFSAYKWQKDGQDIPNSNSNSISVTALGSYAVSVSNDNGLTWSVFSPTPLVVKIKAPTQTPPISTGMKSNVIPAPDGSTSVTMRLPAGYTVYNWFNSSNQLLSTDSTYTTSVVGSYTATVTEQYGCSSNPSAPFLVVNAKGPNGPDPIQSLTATAVSKTSLRLDWTDKANPLYNETFFEVYRSLTPGGPYTLVAKVLQDIVTYTDNGLIPNTNYYYVIRPINNNAAGPLSAEVRGATIADTNPPTPPANLRLNGASTSTSIPIAWDASTDDVGVASYDVYVNGVKTYTVDASQTNVVLYGLTSQQYYSIYVVAKDLSGNYSVPSTQLSVNAIGRGWKWTYYETPSGTTWSNLPNFGTLTALATGYSTSTDISVRQRDVNYGMMWTGYLRIPVTGTYQFSTYSDDGSKLFVNKAYTYSGTATVNNDGAHAAQTATGSISLTAGQVVPITAVFFQAGGDQVMQVKWQIPGTSSFVDIDPSYLQESATSTGTAPASPSGITAVANGYKSVTISWTDNGTNEEAFEIYRASAQKGTFTIVGRVSPNITSYTDMQVQPNTRYYYRVLAVNKYGSSAQLNSYPYTAIWKLNGNTADSSYAGNNATAGSAVTYTSTDVKEGSQAAVFAGNTNAYLAVSNGTSGSFLQDNFSKRTISMWVKPTNVTNANQYIFEQGTRGNGLAIRLNNKVLEAAYGGGGGTTVIKATVTPQLSNNTWYHVAVVFDTNGKLTIYLNGLGYTSTSNTSTAITNSTDIAYIGKASSTNAANNAFNDGSPGTFSGVIDNIIVIDSALNAAAIGALQAGTLPLNMTNTGGLPTVPADPSTLTAAVQGKNIKITWTDNASNESQYEIQRSVGSSTDFRALATIGPVTGTGAQGTYTDSSVFANETYNYRVRATNDGGQSNFSNVASATAPNNPPVVAAIPSRTIRYDNPIQIPLVATDPDGDPITFSFMNLPTFITLMNGPTGPYLNVATDVTKQGTYLNMVVIANDNHGGSDTTSFNLLINDDYPPVLNPIANVSMNEGETQVINLTATDQDTTNTFTWTGVNLPSFITLNGNGLNCTATINPGYVDAGTYPVTVRVTDNKGGTDMKTFTLIISKGHPNGRVLMNFNRRTVSSWDGWNISSTNTMTNLRTEPGDTTRIGIQLKNLGMLWDPSPPVVPSGATTAYPAKVFNEYTYFGALTYNQPDSIPVIISGLDISKVYYLKFFSGSSSWMDNANGATTYRVGDSTVVLYTRNNYSNTANFYNIKPNADGTILAAGLRKDPSYLGEFSVIELGWNYDDGLAPAMPKNFAVNLENQKAKLTWIDVAYNELSYQIFRSQDSINNYTLLASTPPDATSYIDTSAIGNQTYYYKIRAYNSAGGSTFTNYAGITLPNRDPVLDSIPDVKVRAGSGVTINLHATDDAVDQPGLQLLAAGLPSFVTFTDAGSGNGQLVFNPTTDNVGTYNITVTVQDTHGGTGSRSFRLFVSDKNTTLTYFSLGGTQPAAAPWNNLLGAPLIGSNSGNNVVDENNTPNGMTFKLLTTFGDGWNTDNGMNTGQNVGIYQDSVMMTSWYLKSGTAKMVVHGLDPNKRYNFVFFGSQNYGYDASTSYTVNSQTVTLNGAYNIGKTVQVNGVTPSGDSALITLTKPATQDAKSWAYINTLVVESYDPTVAVVSPGSLRATVLDSKRISLVWADRSNNETGFQIYRKTGITGTESLLTTTAAGVTSYMDTNLTPNTPYIYRIRAVKSGVYSDYSGSAGGTTYALNVYVNFCDTSLAPTPWNNTARRPAPGVLISNLLDDSGMPTNIGMTIMDNFAGIYGGQGMNTGNNSGVYPDAVMRQNFVLFAGAHASMKITGLNQSLAYNLTVFSSALDLMDYNTKFTANGKQVTWLNAYYNTQGTATIYNVVPNQNGEIRLDVDAGPTSSYGLLGAMVIQGFTPSNPGAIPGTLQTLNQNVKVAADQPAMNATNGNTSTVFADVSAFPNPFVNQLNIDMSMQRSSSVLLEVFNLNGQLVYGEMLSQVPKGRSTLRINTGGSITIPGYYLIRLTDDQHKTKVIRAIKQ